MLYDPNSKKIKGRERLIEYRKAFQKNQTLKGETPQGEGELNRDGNPITPPQRVVEGWPVLDLGVTPELDETTWNLTVSGLVKTVKTFNWEEFLKQNKGYDLIAASDVLVYIGELDVLFSSVYNSLEKGGRPIHGYA